jgi:hypothetical protein
MPSSDPKWALCLAILLGSTTALGAQPAEGFAVERLYPSAPGAGWFVMDDLDIRGGLGGTMALSLGYERNPLRIASGANHVAVVSDQLAADFGGAMTYDRFRFYLNLDMPFVIVGQSGTAGAYSFTAPNVNPSSLPDPLSDIRLGTDVLLLGQSGQPFRLGAGAQLLMPSGKRADYDTDGTFRAMLRALVAGDVGSFTYAGHVGVHVRPRDDASVPEAPQGSELLFGASGGARFFIESSKSWSLTVGPELYGATAFRTFFSSGGTAFEGLLSARAETAGGALQLRIKLGTGGGIHSSFGAPGWRVLAGIEMLGGGQ